MLLAVDIGNTQTHIGLFDDSELCESWRLATAAAATADQLAHTVSGLCELRSVRFTAIEAAIVSSVVPRLAGEYERMCESYLGRECLVVGPAIRTGMPIRTDSPHEVGADRIVNAVAAYERFGSACVVVDFGTAITYDAVSEDGAYMGGVIAPGIEISIEALASRAAKLPRIELVEPEGVIGRNTAQSIQAGIVFGFAGQVDGIVRRLRGELGAGASVIATGGQASAVAPFSSEIDAVDELLTLRGLSLIEGRNR